MQGINIAGNYSTGFPGCP